MQVREKNSMCFRTCVCAKDYERNKLKQLSASLAVYFGDRTKQVSVGRDRR